MHYLDPGQRTNGAPWPRFDAYLGRQGCLRPRGFRARRHVVCDPAGQQAQTSSLHRFNFATGKVDPEPLMAAPGYDFSRARLIRNRSKLLGAQNCTTDMRARMSGSTVACRPCRRPSTRRMPATTNILTVAADPAATERADRIVFRQSAVALCPVQQENRRALEPHRRQLSKNRQRPDGQRRKWSATRPATASTIPGVADAPAWR